MFSIPTSRHWTNVFIWESLRLFNISWTGQSFHLFSHSSFHRLSPSFSPSFLMFFFYSQREHAGEIEFLFVLRERRIDIRCTESYRNTRTLLLSFSIS